jgi:hypothetical protein
MCDAILSGHSAATKARQHAILRDIALSAGPPLPPMSRAKADAPRRRGQGNAPSRVLGNTISSTPMSMPTTMEKPAQQQRYDLVTAAKAGNIGDRMLRCLGDFPGVANLVKARQEVFMKSRLRVRTQPMVRRRCLQIQPHRDAASARRGLQAQPHERAVGCERLLSVLPMLGDGFAAAAPTHEARNWQMATCPATRRHEEHTAFCRSRMAHASPWS